MCQIIHKVKNYTLPFNLLNSTCITNPDGFGVMMFDGKKVIADKVYTGKDNDPEVIAKFLETLHSEELFIHFRYKTKGLLGTDACHPFKIYDANDREVYLMHNGTFSDYGSSTKVDSEEFGEEVVAPLYDTFLKSGERNPLQNDFFRLILDKFSNAGSKVVLMDNTGSYSIFNEKGGELFEDKSVGVKFWVSNIYSFNKNHRSYTYSGTFHGKGGLANSSVPFSATPASGTALLAAPNTSQKSVPSIPSGNMGLLIKQKEYGLIPKRTPVKSYWKDVLGLTDVDDILDMTFDDIGDLVDLEPENAKLLIKDLIFALYCEMYTSSLPEEEESVVKNEVSVN